MMKIILACATEKEIVTKSVKIALVVGSILNIINQGDSLLIGDYDSVNWFKFALTYTIPFIVSTYTAVSIKMQFKIGEVSSIDANLSCKSCGFKTDVKKGKFVPICPTCNEKTKWRMMS